MKLPQCVRFACLRHRCLLYSQQLDYVCKLHPFGVYEDYCLDFRHDPDAEEEEERSQEELWITENYSWYGNKLIHNRPSCYTAQQQLEILDTHPFFTGTCPQCGHKFETSPPPHAPRHCDQCDWMDNSAF